MLNPEDMSELENTIKREQKINKTKIFYKRYKTQYDFLKFKNIRRFRDTIRNDIIPVDKTNDEQEHLRKRIR